MLVGRTEGKFYRVCFWAEERDMFSEFLGGSDLREICEECVSGQNREKSVHIVLVS